MLMKFMIPVLFLLPPCCMADVGSAAAFAAGRIDASAVRMPVDPARAAPNTRITFDTGITPDTWITPDTGITSDRDGSDAERARIRRLIERALYEHTRDAGQGERNAKEAYDRAVQLRDTLLQIRALNALGASHWIQGAYDLAVRDDLEALRLSEIVRSPGDIALSNNNLGLVFKNLVMLERAEACFREAVRIRTKIDDKAGLMRSLLNLGLIFHDTDRLDSARIMHTRSLALASMLRDSLNIARNLHYLGRIDLVKGSTGSARARIAHALRIYEALGDRNGIALAGVEIARVQLGENRLADARRSAMEALRHALILDSRFSVREATEVLARNHAARGSFREAYDYLTLFRAADDSLRDEAALRRVVQLNIEREIALREKELAFRAKQREVEMAASLRTEAFIRNFLVAGTILLTLIAVILLFAYQSKRKGHALITEQKARIEEANAELAREVETRERLFGIVSHDLRGPLGNIRGMLDLALAEDARLTAAQKAELLDAARKTSDGVLTMLNRLLDWASAQQKEICFNPEPGDLHRTVGSVVAVVEPQARAKNIGLKWSCPQPLRFVYDTHMMSVIVENLLSNAIKFTAADGHVNVTVQRMDDTCILRVEDDGIGMSAERLERIRNRSRIIPHRGTAGATGHGLGLDLCYRFTDLHGGKMTVESVEGKGTVFSVSVPLRET
jgi:signal transduction histidine kinase